MTPRRAGFRTRGETENDVRERGRVGRILGLSTQCGQRKTAHWAYAEPFFPGRYPGDYAWFNGRYQAGFARTSPFAPPDAVTRVPVRPFDAGTGSLFLHSRLTLRRFEAGYLRLEERHPSSTGVKPDFSLYVPEAVFETRYSALYGRHSYLSDDGRWRLGTDVSYHLYEIDPRSRFINTFSLYRDAYKYAFDRTLELREQLQHELTDASTLTLGFSYADHSALAYTADLPAPFDTSKSLASQGFLYPGSDVTDLNGRFLCAGRLEGREKEHLQRIRAATQRMGLIIDDILALSRVGRVEMRRERVDLSEVARAAAARLRSAEPGREASFEIDPGAEAWGDPSLLTLLLENLLANAWKFTSKTPRAVIEFRVTRREGGKVYAVRDNGAGFDPAQAHKLFKPFSRLHALGEYPGTGIGLATVRRIVERHGGKVWAQGEVGKGAEFSFTL